MQPTSTQTVDTDLELKAYIYQQLTDLQPYLIPESQMAVTVQHVQPVPDTDETIPAFEAEADAELEATADSEEVEDLDDLEGLDEDFSEYSFDHEISADGEYMVKLVATMEGTSLEAAGFGEDVYQAFGQAKGNMVQQLNAIHNAMMDTAEREQEIQSWLNGERTLH